MKKMTLMGAVLLAASCSFAHAAEEGAGCGLGASVMEGKGGKGTNMAAAILNNIIIANTFFMTTGDGMMGCDPTQVIQRDELTEIFVAQNMDQITTDTAKGSGDYLNVLASLLGVPETELPRFSSLAQSQFDTLFLDGNQASDVISSLQVAMSSDQHLAPFALN